MKRDISLPNAAFGKLMFLPFEMRYFDVPLPPLEACPLLGPSPPLLLDWCLCVCSTAVHQGCHTPLPAARHLQASNMPVTVMAGILAEAETATLRVPGRWVRAGHPWLGPCLFCGVTADALSKGCHRAYTRGGCRASKFCLGASTMLRQGGLLHQGNPDTGFLSWGWWCLDILSKAHGWL